MQVLNQLRQPRVVRKLLSSIVVVVAIAFVCSYCHEHGLFRQYETGALDAALNLPSFAPASTDHVSLVGITENDRLSMVDENTGLLRSGEIAEVIKKIASHNPRMIVVDLDTSAKEYEPLKKLKFGSIDLIWACRPVPYPPTIEFLNPAPDESAGANDQQTYSAEDVLGMDYQTATTEKHLIGFASLNNQPDGQVRSYPHYISIQNVPEPCECLPTLVKRCWNHETGSEKTDDNESVIMRFTKDRFLIDRTSIENLESFKHMDGRIVILGASYNQEDIFPTPLGPMFGMELLAQAIESELQGPIKPAPEFWMVASDIIVGLSVSLVYLVFSTGWIPLLCLFAIPLVAVLASLVVFQSSAYFFDFIPMLVGVRLHYLIEHAVEDNEIRKELKEAHAATAGHGVAGENPEASTMSSKPSDGGVAGENPEAST